MLTMRRNQRLGEPAAICGVCG